MQTIIHILRIIPWENSHSKVFLFLKGEENYMFNIKKRSGYTDTEEHKTDAYGEGGECVREEKKAKRQLFYDTRRIVGISMFVALAYAVTFVFRIPVMFLTFDAKDAVIIIASLIYGPVSGVVISFLVALIEFITVSGTGIYGFIMNFASSAVFSAAAALIYKYKRNATGAIVAFYSASVAMISVMLILNMLVTPYYMGVSRGEVIALLPKLILPFNAAKALMNSAFAMMLYKPITVAMRRARLLGGEAKMKLNRSSAAIYIAAVITLSFAIALFVVLKK